MRVGLVPAALLVIVLGAVSVAAAEHPSLAKARALYNALDFDGAIAAAEFARVGQFLFRREIAARRDCACNHIIVLPRRDNAFRSRPGVEGNKDRSC